MKLASVKYSEYKGQSKEWSVEQFDLQDINLIVGKNSDGKTRTLNIIAGLSIALTNPALAFHHGDYNATFNDGNETINYEFSISSGKVVREKLTINGVVKLERTALKAKIFNVLVGADLESQVPSNQLMVVRRDNIQYPYLDKLFIWGNGVKTFHFGTHLGKDLFIVQNDKSVYENDPDLKQNDKVGAVFIRGNKLFPKSFKKSIIEDFCSIGYEISDVSCGLQDPFSFEMSGTPLIGILVQEAGRSSLTQQFHMSAGMFRALAIIIYFNYFKYRNIIGSVLIDDIGEGLDYDRSTKLINIIIEKCKTSGIQLLMTTNDRFVMNQIPIDYWQVIDRKGGKVKMFNEKNHPEIFKDFEFTVLNNFDFFASGFFREGFTDK